MTNRKWNIFIGHMTIYWDIMKPTISSLYFCVRCAAFKNFLFKKTGAESVSKVYPKYVMSNTEQNGNKIRNSFFIDVKIDVVQQGLP